MAERVTLTQNALMGLGAEYFGFLYLSADNPNLILTNQVKSSSSCLVFLTSQCIVRSVSVGMYGAKECMRNVMSNVGDRTKSVDACIRSEALLSLQSGFEAHVWGVFPVVKTDLIPNYLKLSKEINFPWAQP